MATASATSTLANQAGRAIVSARGHHIIVDSPPPLGGPNQELNPLDVILAALATCGTFVIETAAGEMEIPLESVSLEAEGDFDPRGVKGVEGIDPRITEFRVKVSVVGPTEKQTETLIEEFKKRCPVYTTLSRSAPILFEIN
jgi:uncharacterized OsmC-like protein